MTVPAQTPVSTHVGNGVTTSFAYGFKLLDQADIQVTVDGVVKTLTTDYTVTGVGVDAGGTIAFVVAPASLTAIALARRVTVQRLTDYQYSGDFQSPTVNRDFDRIVMMLQDSGVNVANALRFPIGDVVSGVLPDVADRALKGLAFDALGAPVATAAAGNADALEAALLSTTVSTGGALVGFNPANAYAPGTVGDGIKDAIADAAAATTNINAFKANLLLSTGVAGTGALLAGYKLPSGVSVGRSLQDKLDDFVSAKDFGLKTTNTGAQNLTAINAAVAFANAVGGCSIHIPRGTYDFSGTINISAIHNLRIVGDGPEATILRITSATADFLYAAGSTMYQCIENLALTSTVVRTAGSMFFATFWRRGLMQRVKITEHITGIYLEGFEQSTLNEVFIVKPSGVGASLIAGKASAGPQAANLNINNCFFRGNNELINDVAVSTVGILVQNCEAIFGVNSDFGQYSQQAMRVAPSVRAANCHFVQCYFDGTSGGDNVLMDGAGIKQQFQFTGCWFNGAGMHAPGAVNCCGLNFNGAGEFYDMNFSGCRFLSVSGSHVAFSNPYMDANFSGCVFVNSGLNGASGLRNSIYAAPPTNAVKFPVFTGCKWQGTGGPNTVGASLTACPSPATGMSFTGCWFDKPVAKSSTNTYWGPFSGCQDPTFATITVPSAITMPISPSLDYVVVNGVEPIYIIPVTYAGHRVTFRPVSACTFVDDGAGGNLRLAGNLVGNGINTITLVCEANGDWREVARATS